MTAPDPRARLADLVVRADLQKLSFGIDFTSSSFPAMRTEAAALVASCLGRDHYIVEKLEALFFSPAATAQTIARGQSVADDFIGLVEAAINLIGRDYGTKGNSPFLPPCDPELWSHISGLVRIQEWAKVPAAVVTFTEDWFRKRTGDPRGKREERLVGKNLYLRILDEHKLGQEPSENEGWRYLGMGLAQAVGNLHRHNLEERDDAEAFAWNVVGLASLLIAEMKKTHPSPTPA